MFYLKRPQFHHRNSKILYRTSVEAIKRANFIHTILLLLLLLLLSTLSNNNNMEIPTFCFPFHGRSSSRIKRINPFTHILDGKAVNEKKKKSNNLSLSEAEIRARLIGFPVYRFTDALLQRFTVNSINNKCQEFYFFCGEDCHEIAQGLVSDAEIHVITVPLAEKREKAGFINEDIFRGVPMFIWQPDFVKEGINGEPCQPAFFRMDDLEEFFIQALKVKGKDHSDYEKPCNIEIVIITKLLITSTDSKPNDELSFSGRRRPLFRWPEIVDALIHANYTIMTQSLDHHHKTYFQRKVAFLSLHASKKIAFFHGENIEREIYEITYDERLMNGLPSYCNLKGLPRFHLFNELPEDLKANITTRAKDEKGFQSLMEKNHNRWGLVSSVVGKIFVQITWPFISSAFVCMGMLLCVRHGIKCYKEGWERRGALRGLYDTGFLMN